MCPGRPHCRFVGSAETEGMCSVCYREIVVEPREYQARLLALDEFHLLHPSAVSINELDDAILGRILSYLFVDELARTVELVCKRWKQVAQKHAYALRKMKLTGECAPQWVELRRCAPYLLDLTIQFYAHTFNQLKEGPSCVERALESLLDAIGPAAQLRHFSLWSVPVIPGWLERLASALPNLHTLAISYATDFDHVEGRYDTPRPQRPPSIFSSEIVKALRCLTHLRYLHTTGELDSIKPSTPWSVLHAGLKTLYYSCETRERKCVDEAVNTIAEQSPNLEILCMSGGDWLGETGLQHVAKLKKLTYLNVVVSPDCINHFGVAISQLPNLRAIGLGSDRARYNAAQISQLVEAVLENAPQTEHFETPSILFGDWHATVATAMGRLVDLKELKSLVYTPYSSGGEGWKGPFFDALRPTIEKGDLEYLRLSSILEWPDPNFIETVAKCKKLRCIEGFSYNEHHLEYHKQVCAHLDELHREEKTTSPSAAGVPNDPRVLTVRSGCYDFNVRAEAPKSPWFHGTRELDRLGYVVRALLKDAIGEEMPDYALQNFYW